MTDMGQVMGQMRVPDAGDGAPPPDPNNSYPVDRRDVLPNQFGSTAPGTFDYATEKVPVYEWQGQRFVGDLQYAPSWPQDLQPVDYVDVPIEPSHVS